ncbi:MAG: hypothetical protein JSU73_11080 [candidate division WOR-3 bacterium]|nr:MAG: hypothetical protein JSU73_11080 [candidate division WOR-3 bacterium]
MRRKAPIPEVLILLGLVASMALGAGKTVALDGHGPSQESYRPRQHGSVADGMLPPTVRVSVPNGGEIWRVGTAQTITWTHGPVGPVGDSIWYRTSDSDTWRLIAALEPATESHVWGPVPDTPSEDCRVRVKAYTTAKSGEDSSDNHFVILYEDVGPTEILAPAREIDSGTTVTPRVVVRNSGSREATFPVTLLIGDLYAHTTQQSLAPEQVDTVSFPAWIAGPIGRLALVCYTALSGDMDPSNDTVRGEVEVLGTERHDVGAVAILAPVGTVDSGTVVTPRAAVRNHGTCEETFPVTFSINATRVGRVYEQTRMQTLAPGQTDTVDFPHWIAQPIDQFVTSCFTSLDGDEDCSNDTSDGRVAVVGPGRHDVGAIATLAPLGTTDSGGAVIPQAVVTNVGSCGESFPVTFCIGGVYKETRRCSLASGQVDTVSFPEWTPHQLGRYPTLAFTRLADDQNRSNDTAFAADPVEVVSPELCDVGAVAVLSPSGTVKCGVGVAPKAVVHNYGNRDQTCPVTFRIGGLYDETVLQEMSPGQTDTVSFPLWIAGPVGRYLAMAFTGLDKDQNRANDTVVGRDSVRVVLEDGHDMSANLIIAPVGDVDMGTVVAPRAIVHNLGTYKEPCPVTLRIGDDYEETVTRTLSPGQTDTAHFPTWVAQPSGTHTAVCFTSLAADENRSNDTTRSRIAVVPVSDVGVEAVLSPTGTVLLGNGIVQTSVRPRSRVVNHGQSNETDFEVRLRIDSVRIGPGLDTVLLGIAYEASTRLRSVLLPGAAAEVDFPEVVLGFGDYAVSCSTALAADRVHSNDRDVRFCTVTSSAASTSAGRFEVIVYTRVGERVRTYESSIGPGDARLVQWDGIDDRGRRVAPGVYLCVLRFEPEHGPTETQSFKLAVTSELTSAVLTWR